MKRHPNVINEADVEWVESRRGERWGERRRQLGMAAGGRKLGASVYELEPGRRSWPYHFHLANEEAIYVLAGAGTLRIGTGEVAVAPGDWVALPVGPRCAHQLINTGDEPLRYLCVSTMIEPDATVYPDSEKVAIFAGSAPGGNRADRTYGALLDGRARLEFWAREPE